MYQAEELVSTATRLVSLPEIYFKAKSVLDDPESSLNDLADVIKTDPALSARILRVANSAFFKFPSKVGSIHQAVSILGTGQTHALVLSASVMQTFSGMDDNLINMDLFWRASIYRAICAKLLAATVEKDVESLFISGMLADIGHLVMYLKMPEPAQKALQLSREASRPLYEVEKELMGFSYAEVGGSLLRQWNLPECVVYPILEQSEPSKAENYRFEAAIIHLAENLTYAKFQNGANDPASIDQGVLELVGINEEAVHDLLERADVMNDEFAAAIRA